MTQIEINCGGSELFQTDILDSDNLGNNKKKLCNMWNSNE